VGIAQTRPTLERLERGVRVRREISGIPPAPYHQRLAKFSGPVDRWFVYDYLIPGVLLMESGVRPADPGLRGSEKTLNFHSCQAITPETATATHYFFASATESWLEEGATEHMYQAVVSAFDEDRRMIEAQQQLIDTTAAAQMRPLLSDAALGQFRFLMKRALEAENPQA
jgi:vanillate O-demethylase monooxygenase subunit